MSPAPSEVKRNWRYSRRLNKWVSEDDESLTVDCVHPEKTRHEIDSAYLGDHIDDEAELIRPWHVPAKPETNSFWAMLMLGGAAMTGGMIGADLGGGE